MSNRNKELDDVLNKARLEALDIAVHENHEYLATIKELRELLVELEWEGHTVTGHPCCPSCKRLKVNAIKGHQEDCKLQAALKEDS